MTRNPFGVTTLITNPGQVYPNQLVHAIANMGASYVVMQVLWENFETSLGVYDWAMLDANIQQYNNAGLGVYFAILTAPSFRKNVVCSDGSHQMDPTSVLSLIEALITRYTPGFAAPHGYIDIGYGLNEDFDGTIGAAKDNFGYAADILNTIAPVIHAANSAWVIGGPAHFHVNKAQVITQRANFWHGGGVSQSGGYNNAVPVTSNFHFYAGNKINPAIPHDPNQADFNQMWQLVRAQDTVAGHSNQDVWCSEFAYQSSQNGSPGLTGNGLITYAQQAQNIAYIVEQCILSEVVTHVSAYTIGNDDSNSFTSAGTPLIYHPVYYALQSIFSTFPASLTTAAEPLNFRDGQGNATFRDGQGNATFRDGLANDSAR